MKISAKIEYACLAILELAIRHDLGEPVRIRDIATQHDIPSRFLVQILLQLKAAGFVASTRGACGGYRLAMPPEQITLRDIICVIEGEDSQSPSPPSTNNPASHVLFGVWEEIAQAEKELLTAQTFGELADKTKQQADSMYYI